MVLVERDGEMGGCCRKLERGQAYQGIIKRHFGDVFGGKTGEIMM